MTHMGSATGHGPSRFRAVTRGRGPGKSITRARTTYLTCSPSWCSWSCPSASRLSALRAQSEVPPWCGALPATCSPWVARGSASSPAWYSCGAQRRMRLAVTQDLQWTRCAVRLRARKGGSTPNPAPSPPSLVENARPLPGRGGDEPLPGPTLWCDPHSRETHRLGLAPMPDS